MRNRFYRERYKKSGGVNGKRGGLHARIYGWQRVHEEKKRIERK